MQTIKDLVLAAAAILGAVLYLNIQTAQSGDLITEMVAPGHAQPGMRR